MAQSRIETRIGLRGGDDVKRQLEDIGKAGERAFSGIGKRAADVKLPTAGDEVRQHFNAIGQAAQTAGNQVRASLIAATQGVTSFSSGAATGSAASGQMRFALQNLSFQVNDVATSLASGGDAFRVFAQQGGQFVQVFQQGGGIGPVLRAAGSAIAGMVTPLTLAAAAAVALAAGIGLVLSRSANAQESARQFDVVLRGIGKSSLTTGQELERAAQGLIDVGLSVTEARAALNTAIRDGVRPTEAARVVRIGQDLNAVLGDGSMEKFVQAAAKGGEPLREFAERLGLIPKGAAAAVSALNSVGTATSEMSRSVNNVFRQSGLSIIDAQRQAAEQIADLTRRKGTEREEIEFQLQRRIVDINRQTSRQLNDLARQRNEENARRLAEFNARITEAAQKAVGDTSIIGQIERRVAGSFRSALTPVQEAFLDLRIKWNQFLDAMANSQIGRSTLEVLRTAITGLASGLAAVTENIKNGGWGAYAIAATAALAVVVPLGFAFAKLASAAVSVGTGLAAIVAAIGWPVILLAGVTALVASFVDWKAVLSGETWKQFIGTLDAAGAALRAIGNYVKDQLVQLFVGAVQAITTAWTDFTTWIGEKITNVLGFFQRLIDKALEVARAIKSAVSGGSAEFPAAAAPSGLASGGLIRGPGTSLSDSILARLSDGEFVIRAAAVDHWGVGVLRALNGLRNPFPGFALGGLAGAMNTPLVSNPRGSLARSLPAGSFTTAASRPTSTVNIHLDGKSFGPFRGDRDVVDALRREAVKASTVSMGRRPSSVG